MKSTTLALSLAAAIVATAQDSEPYYNITSKPFQLVVSSEDGKIQDTLSACHTGAALESLCLSNSNTTSKPNPGDASVFNFNTSIYSQAPEPNFGVPGILTWFLTSANIGSIPSSVYFSYDPTTDTALPIIRTGDSEPQSLAFDSKDLLTVQGYIDYSASPPNGTGNWKEYYRWYACETYFAAYQYETLAWGLGPNKPENPSCVAVNVTRKFV